jgi:uncharacterized membrane protein
MVIPYWLDILAIIWFLTCWIGYTAYSASRIENGASVRGALKHYQLRWMQYLTRRDVRIADSMSLMSLRQNGNFFASTTILLVAGLISMLGIADKAAAILATIPYAAEVTPILWSIKIGFLIATMVYAFFKFVWGILLINFATVMAGGAPVPSEEDDVRNKYAEKVAKMLTVASTTINYGLRAYFYGFAVLSWLIHPVLFIVVASLITLVLYRREFHSDIMHIMWDDLD